MKLSNRKRRFLGRWVSQSLVVGPLAFLLVAGSGCPQLFESDGQRTAHMREAAVGRDLDKTIGASANGTIVNTYAVLSAGVAAGTRTITVDSIANLNVTARFPQSLAKGDLLLIIQMGGATIDQTEGPTYGTVSAANLGNAGHYEFVAVESVAGNAITLACGLKKAYTGPSGKSQVIRVPQYTTLTIATGGFITAPAWNGTIGGVVAVHAEKTLQLNGDGKIDVTGLGFRGGATHNNASLYPSTEARYHATDGAAGGEKGEGIAGYEGELSGGQYGRGAPANGGGGGDAHNAGGGGGANAGDPTTWTGQGVMLTTVTGGTLAWPLDPQYAGRNHPGGGRGGYSFSGADLDATQASGAPELTGWDGDHRRNVGGLGGHPLTNSPGDRLFMGGGGGAGDGNNLAAGSLTNVVAGKGGNGGGIVFVIAGAISGTGKILANGNPGDDTSNAANTASDAAGGGGGGGAVLVHAVSITGITIAADGGQGGSQTAAMQNEAEGPGGGGGGGYLAVSGTLNSVASTVLGAKGGTTRTNGPLSEFPSNGATAGYDGDKTGDASSFLYCGMDPNNVTLTITVNGPASPTGNPRGTFTFTASEGGVTFECAVDGTAAGNWTSCSSPYTTGLLPDGDHTFYVRGTDLSGNKATANYPWKIIAGELDAGTFHTTITDGPAKISGRPMGTFTFTNNHPPVTYQCAVDSTAAAAWTSCSSPYTTGLLPDGDHTFYVRATDVNGTVEAPPASYPWTIIAGLLDGGVLQTQITSAPPAVSGSPIGTFTFTNSHAPVTYQCALDSTAASAWHDCTSPFTTPLLPDGDHTFYVRATDVNGTVEAPPATYPWKIIAGQLDAGILDSGVDASPIVDVQTGDDTADTAADTNTEKADVPIVVADTKPPVVDAGPDGKADVGVVLDTSALDGTARLDGGAADLADTAAIPSGLDAGSVPEPSPDAAVAKEDAAVKEDAAAPIGNKDAAVTTEDKPALLGGGFCAISSSRTSSSGAFALLGLAALALLRRRRDGRR